MTGAWLRAGFCPNQLTVWHAGAGPRVPNKSETVVGSRFSVGEFMDDAESPELQQQFGYELACIHMLGRHVRWVTAGNPLVSMLKCSWGGPLLLRCSGRDLPDSEVISEVTKESIIEQNSDRSSKSLCQPRGRFLFLCRLACVLIRSQMIAR